ncbi:hypothetical protein CFR73_03080 [Novacetimonas maltaceti]|uniref:Uncharacterized protein n=1 Tax=Novacetimonas maltaceti TaxID=1203393 RepID=A0A2S3W5R1_9PROT|nr:hypothetical protein [Novacetimonas maltaceti]POF64216.1 hypothetical protein KMAL_01100 [Novacetimonas maltaceti]PYD61512.1 hypothetical protein CFR73_03080 [Novacetimonas maltaceti]
MKYSSLLIFLLAGLAGAGTAHASPAATHARHHATTSQSPAPGSDAETADLNALSLQKARASLKTPTPAAPTTVAKGTATNGKAQPVQAAGTGTTSPPIRVPETTDTVAFY